MSEHWRPTADTAALRARADLLATIRTYFAEQAVLEVETPVLSRAGVPDPNIESLTSELQVSGTDFERFYLHTSPEFPMKRLLCAGTGDIYQIARVFRAGEQGRRHNPEFTLLEWYRTGFDHHRLMDDVDALLQRVLDSHVADRQDYGDLFSSATGLCPHTADLTELQAVIDSLDCGIAGDSCENRNLCLDLIFSHVVTPQLGMERPVFVTEYPVCQAALARIDETVTPPVAERFELFIQGMEIANGFHELADTDVQRERFMEENRQREIAGLSSVPIDEHLLSALQNGLPDCAGVALGIDRLLMIKLQEDHINKVISFPASRA